MENILLDIFFALLLFTVIVNLIRLWKPIKHGDFISSMLIIMAVITFLVMLVVRTSMGGRIPFANAYEFTLLFAGGVLILAILVRRDLVSPLFDLSVALLTILLLSVASSFSSEIRPLMPALQSGWLYAHVATAVIAYGSFALAACLGIIYLGRAQETDLSLPEVDERIYKLVVLGFTFLTIVIITGAVWAEEVWGSWWTWDPKETWSLVTWLVYAAYLHTRHSYDWKGNKSAWMVVIGFVIVMFTLFGVSVLLPGLHSYV